MIKIFSKQLSKRVYRYTVLWPMAIYQRVNFNRYHKQWSVLMTAYVVISTLSAIEYQRDGSWGMPVILFNIAVLSFLLGSSELILVVDQRYKKIQDKCNAISRSISYYGVAATIVAMCELYSFTVKF